MRAHPVRALERRGELVQRDVGHRFHDLHQEPPVGRELAPPGGRPGLSGSSVPRSAWLAAIRTALLTLIRKCRAAPRRDPPPSMNFHTRSRRSCDNALPMIHLQAG